MKIVLLVVFVLVDAMAILAAIGVARKHWPWTHAKTLTSEAGSLREGYVHRVLVAFDVLMNVILGGYPNETISSRCGRWAMREHTGPALWRGVARFMCAWLDAIQLEHGYYAMSGDLARAEQVVALETSALAQIEARKAAAARVSEAA